MLHQNILETIGRTPLVQLQKVCAHLSCEVYAKLEFFNPGGSVKDRIAYRMVNQAEKEGRIQPGDTLIEPTSGNTGIGLALVGAVKGYKVIIVMPDKMSGEKEYILKALGAKIHRTPNEVAWDHPESHISLARRLVQKIPRAFMLDQYTNAYNEIAHYETTAVEILEDMNYQIDMIVAGAGTGGTITGLARQIKKHCPKCDIIGVDPVGSILAGPAPIKPYSVEGIGYDFIPKALDVSQVTKWVKTQDASSFELALKLIREEGLLCGGSSGAALFGVLQSAHHLKKGQKCVVILPDGARNYMSKFLNPHWLKNIKDGKKSQTTHLR